MKKIISLFALFSFCYVVHGQSVGNSSDADSRARLDMATRLVISNTPASRPSLSQSVMKYATEDGLQKEIDKAYPALTPLARLRVIGAWSDVTKRHLGMFERMGILINQAMAQHIAAKFSLIDLQKIAEQSQGKSFDNLDLLTKSEIDKITATQIETLKPDLERFVHDFLAMNQRLVQEGLISK